jgi:hypothetical protein
MNKYSKKVKMAKRDKKVTHSNKIRKLTKKQLKYPKIRKYMKGGSQPTPQAKDVLSLIQYHQAQINKQTQERLEREEQMRKLQREKLKTKSFRQALKVKF